MTQNEHRERFLNFNINLAEQLLNLKFEGATIEDKEVFYTQHREQLSAEKTNLLTSMYDVYQEQGGFIMVLNHN